MLKNAQNRVFGGLEANYNQDSILARKGGASQSLLDVEEEAAQLLQLAPLRLTSRGHRTRQRDVDGRVRHDPRLAARLVEALRTKTVGTDKPTHTRGATSRDETRASQECTSGHGVSVDQGTQD